MNNREKASRFLDRFTAGGNLDELQFLLDEQKEFLAKWMIENGFSTGHGDAIEDLLEELQEQLKEN